MTLDSNHVKREYFEDPSLFSERFKLFSLSLTGLAIILLIIYVGFRYSFLMGLFTIALFGFLIYPTSIGIGTALFGIRNTEVLERGFFPPYCPPNIRLRYREGFIPWSDVVDIVANRYLRKTDLFPYIVVELKTAHFAIPESYLKNPDFFIYHAEGHTKIVRDREMMTGFHIVHFLPPPDSASIEDDAVVFHYPDKDEKIEFNELKSVKVRGGGHFLTKKGQRMAVLGISDQDILDIRETFRGFRGKRTVSGKKNHRKKKREIHTHAISGLSIKKEAANEGIEGGLIDSREKRRENED